MKKINWSEVTPDTIARTIFLLVSMINGAAAIFGFSKLDIDENTVYTVITGISVIVSAIVGFWKNNSFTSAAIEADKVKDSYKADIEDEELDIDISDEDIPESAIAE